MVFDERLKFMLKPVNDVFMVFDERLKFMLLYHVHRWCCEFVYLWFVDDNLKGRILLKDVGLKE